MTHAYERYDIVNCTVVRHAPYGVIVQLPSGDRGYIDRGELAQGEWPETGTAVDAVLLGYKKDGRAYLSARPQHLADVRNGRVTRGSDRSDSDTRRDG